MIKWVILMTFDISENYLDTLDETYITELKEVDRHSSIDYEYNIGGYSIFSFMMPDGHTPMYTDRYGDVWKCDNYEYANGVFYPNSYYKLSILK